MSDNDKNKNDYWFFLSYSRRDSKAEQGRENPFFERFYKDLTYEVARKVGIPASVDESDIRFYDREGIETGAEWDPALAEALQTCKAMVCLYSPSYFSSEYCGKEFQVFSGRVKEYAATLQGSGDPPKLIIPVFWENPSKLPAALSGLQYADASLGLLYAEKGVSYLLRMDKETAYQEFLMGLGAKIKDEVERHKLPRQQSIKPLREVRSAFHDAVVQPQPGLVPDAKGVRIAWIVYVVGGKSDYVSVRKGLTCYGSSGIEWQPYLPDDENIIGYIASTVATEKGLTPYQISLGQQNLVKALQDAEENNTTVVIIVDPWSIKLHSFAESMRAYDSARLSNCGVIVAWNDKDEETIAENENLNTLLRMTFSRSLLSKDIVFQPSVRSVEELRDKLAAAIEEVKGKINARGRLLRGEADATDDPFPQLPTANSRSVDGQASTGGTQ